MIKRRIEELLLEKNITQTELAEKIDITQATLSRNINGMNPPKAEIVCKIADFFSVSTDYLLGRSDIRNLQIEKNQIEFDDFQLALFGETNELTDEQKEDLLDFAQFLKSKNKK